MRTNQYPNGSHVVYTQPDDSTVTEYGTVTSTDSRWVWVRYGNRKSSQATHPDNLQIIDAADEIGLYQT